MPYKRLRPLMRLTLVAFVLAVVSAASASVIIVGTRIVYPSGARDVNVRLSNNGKLPALVQVWLDTGSAEVAPENIDVPFRLTPTLFRMEPSKNQSLRLVYAPESAERALPQDKESLLWFNVLEVPPRPAASKEQNYLQFAVRSRIKLFFRPEGLSGSAAAAPAALRWTALHKGHALHVTATNPTPFHVSFGEVEVQPAGKERGVAPAQAGMVAPGGSETFVFENVAPGADAPIRVRYKFINDFGALTDGEALLGDAPLPVASK